MSLLLIPVFCCQILDDYASQLAHLRKELAQVQADYKEWEDSSGGASNANGTATTNAATATSAAKAKNSLGAAAGAGRAALER